jgi:hypothetical protein
MAVTETHFRWSKLRQTELNFLYALHQHVNSYFYIWLNLSCLAKTRERDVPTILSLPVQVHEYDETSSFAN